MSEVLTTAEIGEGALGDEFTGEASIFSESAGESLTNLDLVTTENEESGPSAAKEITTSVGQVACGVCVGCPFFNQCVKPQAVAMKQELADQEESSTDGEAAVEEGLVANVADFMPKQSYLEELLAPDDMDEVRETGRGEVIMAGYQAAESQTLAETMQSKVELRRERVAKNKSAENEDIDKPASDIYQKSEVENVESGSIEPKGETTESTIVSHNDSKEAVIDETPPIELDSEATFIDTVQTENIIGVRSTNGDDEAIYEKSLANSTVDDMNEVNTEATVEELVTADEHGESLGQFDEAAHEIQELPNIIATVDTDFGEEFVNKAAIIKKVVDENPLNVVKSATNSEQEESTSEKLSIFVHERAVAVENGTELEAESLVKMSNFSKNLELAPEKPMTLAVENQPLKRDEEVDDKAENFTLEKAETNQNLRVAEEFDDSSREVIDDEIKDKADVNLIDKEVPDVFSGDFPIVNTAMKSVEKKSLNCEEADDVDANYLNKNVDTIVDNHPEAEAANKGYGLSWLVELVGVVAVFATIGGRSRGSELV